MGLPGQEVTASFVVTTRAQDFTPDPFSFTSQSGVEPTTTLTSNAASITGLDSNASISIIGGEYQIDSGDFTSASGNINNNQSVKMRLTSGAYDETKVATLTIGTRAASFVVSARAANTIPNAFVFTPASRTAIDPNTLATATAFITGIEAPTNIILSGTTTEAYYRLGDSMDDQTSGMVSDNTTITLYLTSSGNFNGVASALITVGGISASFTGTTRAQDFTPDPFSFTSQSGAALATPIISNAQTIAGIDTMTTISIIGGSYIINDGMALTSASMVFDGRSCSG